MTQEQPGLDTQRQCMPEPRTPEQVYLACILAAVERIEARLAQPTVTTRKSAPRKRTTKSSGGE